MEISPKTVLTAIIGNPVEHSLSPTLHNAVYKTEDIDAVMLAFGSPDIGGLVAAIRTLPMTARRRHHAAQADYYAAPR